MSTTNGTTPATPSTNETSSRPSRAPAFPPPTLPQGKEQWRDEAQRLEGAVLLVVDAFMTKHFRTTTKEAIAVIDTTAPLAAQIRREAFKVLRQHRHKKAEEEPEAAE